MLNILYIYSFIYSYLIQIVFSEQHNKYGNTRGTGSSTVHIDMQNIFSIQLPSHEFKKTPKTYPEDTLVPFVRLG